MTKETSKPKNRLQYKEQMMAAWPFSDIMNDKDLIPDDFFKDNDPKQRLAQFTQLMVAISKANFETPTDQKNNLISSKYYNSFPRRCGEIIQKLNEIAPEWIGYLRNYQDIFTGNSQSSVPDYQAYVASRAGDTNASNRRAVREEFPTGDYAKDNIGKGKKPRNRRHRIDKSGYRG